MDDSIRRRAYSSPRHPDVFEEVFDEAEDIEAKDVTSIEYDSVEVEESEPNEAIRAKFSEPVPDVEDDFELGHIREKGMSREEISFEGNEGVEFSQSSDSVVSRAKKLEKVNDQLKGEGIRRRYVLTKSDAPEGAFVHEDSIGKYFYEAPFSLRPSDVSKVVEEDSWFNLSSEGRVLATVMLLDKSYPWALEDAKSERAVDKLLERVLTLEVDDLESEDVYSMDMKSELVALLSDR